MKYISTRGIDNEGVCSALAIKRGLATDGGLYMPESIPHITEAEIRELIGMSYPERAANILGRFLSDYTHEELLEDARGAYSTEKFGACPAPITDLGSGMHMLELWHGPTCAFKDMALQIMPRLFVRALRKCNEHRCSLILVATSGDTGKAALEGYRDIEGTKIKVFYPTDGVSKIQKLQMQTQEGGNVSVSGIVGNFDDAQSGVKRIFADARVASELDGDGVFLSSANSINWGRLVPQIVYYVSAYCDLVKSGSIVLGDAIDVCVPTGNFGNIFACYIAKRMGLPIGKMVCASNVNNVLTDFLTTGVYDRNRAFHATISPSMDILISSNLERLLYLTLGSEKCRMYMTELAATGRYSLTESDLTLIRADFEGLYTDEAATCATIKTTYEEKNCLIDTHTAVAVNAALRYMNASEAERKMLVVSTASPYKFAKDVYRSLCGETAADGLGALDALCRLTSVAIPAPLASLRGKDIRFDTTIDKDDMEASTLAFARD